MFAKNRRYIYKMSNEEEELVIFTIFSKDRKTKTFGSIKRDLASH